MGKIMEIEQVFDKMSDEARKLANEADWLDSFHADGLSELYRFAHKTVGDFISCARDEKCTNLDELNDLLDKWQYNYFNFYKYYQSEHFEHLAELYVFGYRELGHLAFIILKGNNNISNEVSHG